MVGKRAVFVLLVALGFIGAAGWSAMVGETAVAQTTQPRAYLPFIAKSGTGVIGPVHEGIATYYDATGAGNCLFPATPDDLMVAAINDTEYDNALWCGAYVRVEGRKGSVVVRIVDRCADCYTPGHLDLSREAFALIDDIPLGRVPITWQVVSPELTGPVRFEFKDGSNQWWTAVQVRNHRNPVAKFEYQLTDGTFREVPRQMWNYFVQTNPGMGTGPYTFRVTDILGNKIVSTNIPHSPPGVEINGSGQFPPP